MLGRRPCIERSVLPGCRAGGPGYGRKMPRSWTVLTAALVLLVSAEGSAQAVRPADDANTGGGMPMIAGAADPLMAPKAVAGRVCPTKEFTVGDGWGADRGRRKHRGIDLSAPRGTGIFAVEAGRINRTKKQANGALQIVLRGASGSKYYYGHMDHVFIKGGQRVKAGEVIGTMGDTGSPGAVHLHFEYWKSGRESDAINPARFVKRHCKGSYAQ